MSVDTTECRLRKIELEEAITCLKAGGVVAHACEGVWGLACNPYDKIAVQRVLDLKNRDVSKGLLVIGGTVAVFEEELCRLSTRQRQVVEMSWPGPSSWIVVTDRYPDWITGDKGSVGIRVPGHRQARALAAGFGGAIVSTSANRSGEPSLTKYGSVVGEFGGSVDFVLPGEIAGNAGSSTIRIAKTGEFLR